MAHVLRLTRSEHPVIDVVFVHGLDGDLRDSWDATGGGDGVGAGGWPAWLAEDFPGTDVWLVGYPAASSKWHKRPRSISILDRATNLLAELQNRGIGARPVIFIAHSMGGLIVKEMLLQSAGNPKSTLADEVRALMLLATPNTGASAADFADRFRRIYRSTPGVSDLRRDGPWLRQLNSRFRDWASRAPIVVRVMFEQVAIRGFIVVDGASADPGLADVSPIPVDEDHSTICKPRSRHALVYLESYNLVREILLQLDPNAEVRPLPHVDGRDLRDKDVVGDADSSGSRRWRLGASLVVGASVVSLGLIVNPLAHDRAGGGDGRSPTSGASSTGRSAGPGSSSSAAPGTVLGPETSDAFPQLVTWMGEHPRWCQYDENFAKHAYFDCYMTLGELGLADYSSVAPGIYFWDLKKIGHTISSFFNEDEGRRLKEFPWVVDDGKVGIGTCALLRGRDVESVTWTVRCATSDGRFGVIAEAYDDVHQSPPQAEEAVLAAINNVEVALS